MYLPTISNSRLTTVPGSIRQKIGVLERIGNDSDAKRRRLRIAHRKAHAVDRHGTFLYGAQPAALRLVFKREIPTAVSILFGRTAGRLVDVSLHDVAVEQRVGLHRAFKIHEVSHLQQTEVAPLQSLFHGRHGVGVVHDLHDRKAHAVVSHAWSIFNSRANGAHDKSGRALAPCPTRYAVVAAAATTSRST